MAFFAITPASLALTTTISHGSAAVGGAGIGRTRLRARIVPHQPALAGAWCLVSLGACWLLSRQSSLVHVCGKAWADLGRHADQIQGLASELVARNVRCRTLRGRGGRSSRADPSVEPAAPAGSLRSELPVSARSHPGAGPAAPAATSVGMGSSERSDCRDDHRLPFRKSTPSKIGACGYRLLPRNRCMLGSSEGLRARLPVSLPRRARECIWPAVQHYFSQRR